MRFERIARWQFQTLAKPDVFGKVTRHQGIIVAIVDDPATAQQTCKRACCKMRASVTRINGKPCRMWMIRRSVQGCTSAQKNQFRQCFRLVR